MLGMFLFTLKYELVLVDASRNPDLYGLSHENLKTGKITHMPFHHRFLNYIHDHPFVMVAGLGLPFASMILYKQMQLKHLKISQRIMQTRVFAQGGVISIALSTMAIKEYMDKRGRFPEPDDE